MPEPPEQDLLGLYADVALPLPLPDPLTYEVPADLAGWAQVGVRARVGLGKRRLTGVIVEVHRRRPEGMELRPLDEILDREPVVTPELLDLARFTAAYYLAPLGEALRSMLPADLPPWGDRRVWLTDAGAIAPARGPEEAAVIAALRSSGISRFPSSSACWRPSRRAAAWPAKSRAPRARATSRP